MFCNSENPITVTLLRVINLATTVNRGDEISILIYYQTVRIVAKLHGTESLNQLDIMAERPFQQITIIR
jgi:hypothetical protein